jgi:hypothetical protein
VRRTLLACSLSLKEGDRGVVGEVAGGEPTGACSGATAAYLLRRHASLPPQGPRRLCSSRPPPPERGSSRESEGEETGRENRARAWKKANGREKGVGEGSWRGGIKYDIL